MFKLSRGQWVFITLVFVASFGVIRLGQSWTRETNTEPKPAESRGGVGLSASASGELPPGAGGQFRAGSEQVAVRAGGRLEVPEDASVVDAKAKPAECETWVLRVVDWRRSSSGHSLILQSHRARRNAWGEWETPAEGRTVLLGWDLWVELGRPSLVGKKIEATGFPQLPKPGEAESKTLRVVSLVVEGQAPKAKP